MNVMAHYNIRLLNWQINKIIQYYWKEIVMQVLIKNGKYNYTSYVLAISDDEFFFDKKIMEFHTWIQLKCGYNLL